MALKLREPICTVLGHVDVGKTSFLDRLRDSSLLKKEAGGITQKIGITEFSKEALSSIIGKTKQSLQIPGLLFVDTPGHECFSYQRICGASISDLVIVLVDIIKGLEKQTIDCINLLKETKTPFVIALNKLDIIYGWKTINLKKRDGTKLQKSLNIQPKSVIDLLDSYISNVICQLAELEINAQVYYKNKDPKTFVSLVPISSKTGEGIPDLLLMINILTTKFLKNKLIVKENITNGFIVETITDKIYGKVFSAILLNGKIENGQTLFLEQGSIKVNKLYVTDDKHEIKDKLTLVQKDNIIASSSFVFKIHLDSIELEGGTRFSTIDKFKKNDIVEEKQIIEKGVHLVAPTKGMIIALNTLCSSENIPVKSQSIGNITKHDIIKAAHQQKANDKLEYIYNKQYSILISFGAQLDKSVKQFAVENNVHIIENEVIYRLTEGYHAYVSQISKEIKEMCPNLYSCELGIIERCVFIKKNPILIGVRVCQGKLVEGMILEANNNQKHVVLGQISSIQKDNKPLKEAELGDEVCIKIEPIGDNKPEYGKDFDHTYKLYTHHTDQDKYIMKKYKDVFLK